MGWGEASTPPTEKSKDNYVGANDVIRNRKEHAEVAPIYLTVMPDHPNGQHVICSFTDRSGAKHVDLFYVDKTKPIEQQLELISAVAGGGLFEDLTLVTVLGPQD